MCRGFFNQVESDIEVAEQYFGSLVYTRNSLMFDQPTDHHATRFFEKVSCVGGVSGEQVDQLLVACACAHLLLRVVIQQVLNCVLFCYERLH